MDPATAAYMLLLLCGLLLVLMLVCLTAACEEWTKDHKREHEHFRRLTRIHLEQRQGQDEMHQLTREYLNRIKK